MGLVPNETTKVTIQSKHSVQGNPILSHADITLFL